MDSQVKAGMLKKAIEEYVIDNTELFLKEFYSLCYNEFYMFEYGRKPLIDKSKDSDELLRLLLKLKYKIENTPICDTRSYSTDNYHWYVSDIFNIKPRRYGPRGSDVVWEYFQFYFELHSISIDVVPVKYVIERAKEILDIYYRYEKLLDRSIISSYWNYVLTSLIRARYKLLIKEMKLLK